MSIQLVQPVDVEEVLREDVSAIYDAYHLSGRHFSAGQLPPDLGHLPAGGLAEINFKRSGGSRRDLVADTHGIVVDLYTTNWSDANYEGQLLVSFLAQLPYRDDTRVQYRSVNISTLPYALSDTGNAVLCRTRMLIEVSLKASITIMEEPSD